MTKERFAMRMAHRWAANTFRAALALKQHEELKPSQHAAFVKKQPALLKEFHERFEIKEVDWSIENPTGFEIVDRAMDVATIDIPATDAGGAAPAAS